MGAGQKGWSNRVLVEDGRCHLIDIGCVAIAGVSADYSVPLRLRQPKLKGCCVQQMKALWLCHAVHHVVPAVSPHTKKKMYTEEGSNSWLENVLRKTYPHEQKKIETETCLLMLSRLIFFIYINLSLKDPFWQLKAPSPPCHDYEERIVAYLSLMKIIYNKELYNSINVHQFHKF